MENDLPVIIQLPASAADVYYYVPSVKENPEGVGLEHVDFDDMLKKRKNYQIVL